MRDNDKQGARSLFLAGPFEFTPCGEDPDGPASLAQSLKDAYDLLDYDIGYLSPREADWLSAAGLSRPEGWRTASVHVQFSTVDVNNTSIGIIYLPMLPAGQTSVPRFLMKSIAAKAQSLRSRTKLVIGISPWGFMTEKHYLDAAGPVFDILFGAGPGPGLAGRLEAGGKTFWVRSYSKGRAVHVLRLNTWPRHDDADWKWTLKKDIVLDFRPLRDNTLPDSEMARTLRKLFPNAR